MKYFYRALFYPARLYWFLVKPIVYGVGAIIEKDGQLLMVRQTYGDRNIWHFPGGGKKQTESALDAVTREVKEELGIEATLVKLGEFEETAEHRRVRSTCFYGIYNGDTIIIDPKEIEEAKWCSILNMPENMSPVAKASFRLYSNLIR